MGIVLAWLAKPTRGGDTGPLMTGTEALGRCVAELDLVSCAEGEMVGPYPLVQYLPDLAADALLELGNGGRTRVLAAMSVVGVLVAVGAGWRVLRRIGLPEWRWALLLVAASGPMLAYGNTTWGEMTATALVTVLVAAALVPARPLMVGLAAFGASLTKETGYPFVIGLGLVALLLARRRTREAVGRHVVFGIAGVMLGVAASSAFNLLRYGTPKNAYYLDPALRTTDVGLLVERAAGLFVSPSGGIVVFWPLASLVVAVCLVPALASAAGGATGWRTAWPAAALVAVLAGLVAGLAVWWSPFGWWAWGPRLSLPWVLPLVLVSLAAFGASFTPRVARLLASRGAFLGTAALLVLVALPHVGLLWRPQTIGDFFLRETAACPGGGPPPTAAYDACLREEMWERRPIVIDALAGVATPGGVVTALLLAAIVAGSLWLFRREAMARSA